MAKNYKIRMEYLKQLRDMFESFVDDPMVARDYLRLDLLIERLEHDFQQTADNDGIVDQLGEDYKHWADFRKYVPKLKRFFNGGLYFSEAVSPKFKEIKVSDEDTVMLAREFFSKQGEFFVKHFDNFLEDEAEDHIDFFDPSKHSSGEMMYLHTTGDKFIFAANYSNIVKPTAFVHEAQHVIDNEANPEFFENNVIRETAAVFMELLATDYFNNFFGLDNQNLLRQFQILSIIKMDTRDALYRDRMIKIYKKIKDYKPDHIYKRLTKRINTDYADFMADYSIYQLYNYQIPYLTAIELYTLYQVDKDKALNILIDIILNGTPKNIFTLLAKHGISLNKHSHQYEEELCLKLGI